MLPADRTHRSHDPLPATATSAGVGPGLVETLDLLGVLGFALFFWLLQLLAAD